MKRVLLAFAWVGLLIGLAVPMFVLLFGPWTLTMWLIGVTYALAGLFWFALCSVLVQTLDRIESAQRQIEALHHEVKKLRA